ncbi:MAG: SufD family Fe-S cluster assembly protein [Candidatus Izemoplasmatales bacterium]
MRIPTTFRDRSDIAVIGPRKRDDRLSTGTMTASDRGLRFIFGTMPQSAPATLVMTGSGERIVLRFRAAHPAKVLLYLSSADTSRWHVSVDVEDGAEATLSCFILGSTRNASFDRRYAIGEAASLDLSTFLLNGGTTTVADHAVISGALGAFRAETLAVLTADDRLAAVQDVRHLARSTTSSIVNSLVAAGSATIGFDVTGAIGKGNAGSDCKQSNRGVLLGEKAVIEVSPKLLIDEFDVQAGHGCAIGRVNADELYYLTSRGLDETTAKRLVVSGYVAPFVAKIDDPSIRRNVEKMLSTKLGGDI